MARQRADLAIRRRQADAILDQAAVTGAFELGDRVLAHGDRRCSWTHQRPALRIPPTFFTTPSSCQFARSIKAAPAVERVLEVVMPDELDMLRKRGLVERDGCDRDDARKLGKDKEQRRRARPAEHARAAAGRGVVRDERGVGRAGGGVKRLAVQADAHERAGDADERLERRARAAAAVVAVAVRHPPRPCARPRARRP